MMEIWRDIRGNPKYEVSNFGSVRNKKTGRYLTPYMNRGNGYYRVDLGGKQQYVHRLVAENFLDLGGYEYKISHENGDKTDNRLANLNVYSTAYFDDFFDGELDDDFVEGNY